MCPVSCVCVCVCACVGRKRAKKAREMAKSPNEEKLRITEVDAHVHFRGKPGQAGGAGRRLRGGDRIGLPCLIRLIKSECAVAPHCANGKCGGGTLTCVCGVIWGAEAPNFHFAPLTVIWRRSSGPAALICTWRAPSATFPLEFFLRLSSFHLQNFA